jgi:hypothetical protein
MHPALHVTLRLQLLILGASLGAAQQIRPRGGSDSFCLLPSANFKTMIFSGKNDDENDDNFPSWKLMLLFFGTQTDVLGL